MNRDVTVSGNSARNYSASQLKIAYIGLVFTASTECNAENYLRSGRQSGAEAPALPSYDRLPLRAHGVFS
jgi:hypothetical protein